MDRLYRVLLPPVRFATRHDAEVAHDALVRVATAVSNRPALTRLTRKMVPAVQEPSLRQNLMGGLNFSHPFGIAAGLDKNGATYPALDALMTPAFLTLGGVTPQPQPGNPRPRLVRIGSDGLLNAMGFPNHGAAAVRANIERLGRLPGVPLGLQMGKQKATNEADVAAEYAGLVRTFAGVADYFELNVSSPNTPGLRALQDPRFLDGILAAVVEVLDEQTELAERPRHRLLVKLSPDLGEDDVAAAIDLVMRYDAGGVVLTNTTTARPVPTRHNDRPGGFSGSALYGRSSKLVRFAAGLLPRDRVLVATGGVDTVDRAYEMLRYADLVGNYTGLVLKGPGLLRELAAGVAERLRYDGFEDLAALRTERPAL